MKYSPKQYAAALLETLDHKSPPKQKEIMKNFLLLLRRNKDWSRREIILREIEKEYFHRQGIHKVSVESPVPVSTHLKAEIKNILGTESVFFEKVDTRILAGVKILIDEETLIDASGKKILNSLFAAQR